MDSLKYILEVLGSSFPVSVNNVPGSSQIPINYYEINQKYVIELSLAGYSREDIEVNVKGHRLQLIAKAKSSEGFLESKVLQHSFSHIDLDREIDFPEYLDISTLQVTMQDGLLRLVMQRFNEEKQSIKIGEHTDQYIRDNDGA
jgi:HSP20 family molecular chaperone IbpA